MVKRLSPKQLFLLLYLLTGAGILTPLLLMNYDFPGRLYGLPFFLLPFIIIFATFFVVIAVRRGRTALAKLEIPKKYSPKHSLLLLWLSGQAFLLGVILHNGFYGLGMIAGHIVPLSYLLEGLHVAFFIIAIPIAPAGFVVGAVGRMWDWAVVKPVEEMKTKGIQLPTDWRYFAPLSCYRWLWRFGKGIEAITEGRMGARRVFAAVFLLGVIGFVIVQYIIQHRLIKAGA